MTDPGVASRVVKEIMAEHPTYSVVKVDISVETVEVSFLTPERQIKAFAWRGGEIVEVDSDVADISQATFDPREFNISNVGALFATAEEMGASSSAPELQIVEYSPGEVLMTVTTSPESATVFFRKDGTPITHLDFTVTADVEIGISDAMDGATEVYALVIDPDVGVWVDTPGQQAGTIQRRTRQAKLPAYSTLRSEQMAWPTFNAEDLDVSVVTSKLAAIRKEYKLLPETQIEVLIDGHLQRSGPTISYTFVGNTLVTDLNGVDITQWVA